MFEFPLNRIVFSGMFKLQYDAIMSVGCLWVVLTIFLTKLTLRNSINSLKPLHHAEDLRRCGSE